MPNCCLTKTPSDPSCDFKSGPCQLTLVIVDKTGTVKFETVKVNGSAVSGLPSKTAIVQLPKGRNTLDIVYVFSDPENGAGELHEQCDGSPLLDRIDAGNVAVEYIICTA